MWYHFYLEEKKKAESEKESKDITDGYSTDTRICFKSYYLLKEDFNIGFTDQKSKVNSRKNLLSSSKDQPKHQPQIFLDCLR